MPRFGTDGVRGDAETDLSDSFVVALGRAVARVLQPGEVLIGRDTRASGVRIAHGVGAGLRAGGATPVDLGVLPTPAIAFVAQQRGLPAAVVSASHNPWTDNGVKILGADGRKLPDDVERAIERELETAPRGNAHTYSDLDPTLDADAEAAETYVQHLVRALERRTLDGLHVVLDCANGAAFDVGPRALRAAGARVDVLHALPDGRNINADCGSTHTASLQDAVRQTGATVTPKGEASSLWRVTFQLAGDYFLATMVTIEVASPQDALGAQQEALSIFRRFAQEIGGALEAAWGVPLRGSVDPGRMSQGVSREA